MGKKEIYFIVSGMFIFSLQDILVKMLSDNVNLFQVLFFRSILAIKIISFFLIIKKETTSLSSSNIISAIKKSFFFFIGYTSFYYAQTQMPVSNALTLFYLSPFFATIISLIFLKEKIDLSRWLIMTVGFSGIYFVEKPKFKELKFINLLPVICVFFIFYLWF